MALPFAVMATLLAGPGRADDVRQPSEFVEPGAHVKQNIVLCYERGLDYLEQMRNFTNAFFEDDFNIIDGYAENAVDDATDAYVGHYPLPADAHACAQKYAPLAHLLEAQVNQQSIDAAMEWAQSMAPGIPLEPVSNGYSELDGATGEKSAIVVLCHIEGQGCIQEMMFSMFNLDSYFCQYFDCDAAIAGKRQPLALPSPPG